MGSKDISWSKPIYGGMTTASSPSCITVPVNAIGTETAFSNYAFHICNFYLKDAEYKTKTLKQANLRKEMSLVKNSWL